MNREDALGSSFRDPSGFVFERDGVLYRQVDGRYAADYDHLISSGLYAELVDQKLEFAAFRSSQAARSSRVLIDLSLGALKLALVRIKNDPSMRRST